MNLKRKTKLQFFGILCIMVGLVSFITIIIHGDPNLGPSVWLSIGVYLLYKARKTEK